MSNSSRKTEWVVWTGLAMVIITVGAMYVLSRKTVTKPVALQLPVIGRISDFSLTNQNNATVTLSQLRGKVWVADIIFTRCPGPCSSMTHHLAELQTNLQTELPDAPVKLVTLTSDPENDTPPVLKKYSERFN